MAGAYASQKNHHTEQEKTEQIITEFFAKSLHIILESRSAPVFSSSRQYSGDQFLSSPSPTSSSSSSSSVKPRDKWFSLALRECPAALENLDLWHQTNHEPMVVDVLLVSKQKPMDFDDPVVNQRFPSSWNSRHEEEFMTDLKSEKIIERWIVQYESNTSRKKIKDSTNKGSKRGGVNNSQSLYKKCIIVLRSLYLTVRIIPAYKLYRDLNSSGKIHTYSLAHRVSSFVEPFTRREEAEMRQFAFTPLETSCGGRLCLSVLYRPTLSDVNSESSTPISPRFIPDYVGSPTTNPLKRFPSLPRTGLDSQGSPSSFPFARRHSWSYDVYRNFAPSMSSSPSPTYSDSRALASKMNTQLVSSQRHPLDYPYAHNASLADKNISVDEYWPSSTFSPSPSPSPPNHLTSDHLPKALLHSESAPVSIPPARLANNPASHSSNVPPLSPSLRDTKMNSTRTDNTRTLMKLGDVSTGTTTQKASPLWKDESGNLSGAKLSSKSSSRTSFSRSFGRFSFQDEFDDSEFCPFAVDDIDTADPRIRSESFDGKGHINEPLDSGGLLPVRTQDAEVGSLVQMLKTARPLRQDFSNSRVLQVSQQGSLSKSIGEPDEISNGETQLVQNPASDIGITSSGSLMLKTTSEALEELQSYMNMKEKLLEQGSEYQARSAETVDRGRM